MKNNCIVLCIVILLCFASCTKDNLNIEQFQVNSSLSDISNSSEIRYSDEDFPDYTPEQQKIIDNYVAPYAVTYIESEFF